MKIKILIISFLFLLNSSYAKNWNLSDCINYALKNRSELIKQENEIILNSKKYIYSKYDLLPSLNSEINHNIIFDNRINRTISQWEKNKNQSSSIGIHGSIVLFNGFQISNKIKQSKIVLSKSYSLNEKIKNSIKIDVIQAFYEVLMAKENIAITEKAIETTKQQISLISIIVEAGKKSEIDLFEINARLEKEISDNIFAKKQFDQAYINLKKTMNYDESESITLQLSFESILIDQKINVDSIYIQSISILPEFKLAKQDSVFWSLALKQIKGQYAPKLSINGQLSSRYESNPIDQSLPAINYTFQNQINHNYLKQIGVSLVIPIYNKHKIKTQLIEKEKVLKDVHIDNSQLYKDIYLEVEQLCTETLKRQENIKSLQKRYDYYRKIYDMRNKQYQLGGLSITDLLIADINKKNAEMQLSYEKYNLLYNLKLIDFYIGNI